MWLVPWFGQDRAVLECIDIFQMEDGIHCSLSVLQDLQALTSTLRYFPVREEAS